MSTYHDRDTIIRGALHLQEAARGGGSRGNRRYVRDRIGRFAQGALGTPGSMRWGALDGAAIGAGVGLIAPGLGIGALHGAAIGAYRNRDGRGASRIAEKRARKAGIPLRAQAGIGEGALKQAKGRNALQEAGGLPRRFRTAGNSAPKSSPAPRGRVASSRPRSSPVPKGRTNSGRFINRSKTVNRNNAGRPEAPKRKSQIRVNSAMSPARRAELQEAFGRGGAKRGGGGSRGNRRYIRDRLGRFASTGAGAARAAAPGAKRVAGAAARGAAVGASIGGAAGMLVGPGGVGSGMSAGAALGGGIGASRAVGAGLANAYMKRKGTAPQGKRESVAGAIGRGVKRGWKAPRRELRRGADRAKAFSKTKRGKAAIGTVGLVAGAKFGGRGVRAAKRAGFKAASKGYAANRSVNRTKGRVSRKATRKAGKWLKKNLFRP